MEETKAQTGEPVQSNEVKAETKVYSTEQLQARLKEVNEESKGYRLRLQEEKRQREDAERQRLESDGKWQELADKYRKELEQSKTMGSKLKSAFEMKVIADQISTQAQRMGCGAEYVDLILNTVDPSKFSVDENLSVDTQQVTQELEKIRAAKPRLFEQPTPRIHDGVPRTPIVKKKSLNDMGTSELIELWKKL